MLTPNQDEEYLCKIERVMRRLWKKQSFETKLL